MLAISQQALAAMGARYRSASEDGGANQGQSPRPEYNTEGEHDAFNVLVVEGGGNQYEPTEKGSAKQGSGNGYQAPGDFCSSANLYPPLKSIRRNSG